MKAFNTLAVFGILHQLLSPLINASELHPRIVNGKVAPSGEYSYTCQIYYQEDAAKGAIATGTLIAPNVVLTTARNTYGKKVGDYDNKVFSIRFGTPKEFSNGLEHRYSVRDIMVPDSFTLKKLDNNIGLIILDENVPEDVAKPVKIYTGDDFWGADAVAAGFGLIKDDTTTHSNKIMVADVSVGSYSFCKAADPDLDNGELCSKERGEGVCWFDQGGPLIGKTNDTNEDALIGINTFVSTWSGNPKATCGSPNGSGTYMQVGYYIDFIEDNTNLDAKDITISSKSVLRGSVGEEKAEVNKVNGDDKDTSLISESEEGDDEDDTSSTDENSNDDSENKSSENESSTDSDSGVLKTFVSGFQLLGITAAAFISAF